MNKAVSTLLVGLTAFVGTESRVPDAGGVPATVIEIATDSLRDVAVAVYSPRHPIIYYNPTLMQKLGPLLSAFFMAHEYGHIVHHDTRANALSAGRSARDSLLQLRELEADCYAAMTLAASSRPAVDAAIRFFSRMGPFRYDAEHPTGAQRASRILSCLPAPTPSTQPRKGPPSALKGAPGVPARPISIVAAPVSAETRWREIHFRIGGINGTVSSVRPPSTATVRNLGPGTYEYAVQVDLYSLDDLLQLNPAGSVTGRGRITLRGGEALGVEISSDGAAVLLVEGD